MNIKENVEKMKMIQNTLLDFVDKETNSEENYSNFLNIIKRHHIIEDRYEFKLLLRLINQIGNDHRRGCNFINKIEKILEHFSKDIKKCFSNDEIFKVFDNNKIILLFLILNKIIIMDEFMASQIINPKYIPKMYLKYFRPEIKNSVSEKFSSKYRIINYPLFGKSLLEKIRKEVPEDFYEKRKTGENDNYLCYLIRKDDGKEFGVYLYRNNLSFNSSINASVFETNNIFFDKHDISLFEYASFYGSNEVIKFIKINGEVELTPSMWKYAIHSNNAELIKYLEDNVSPPNNNYERILKESIKCHHNDISKYIIDNLIEEEDLQYNIKNNFNENLYQYAFEYYNFCFFPENIKDKNMFLYLCQYDYYPLVKLYLQEEKIDINGINIEIPII